jgi:triosephosphate isomerase (TIM)
VERGSGEPAAVRRPIVGASWKMNLTSTESSAYLDALLPLVDDVHDRDLFVLPTFTSLWVARERLGGSNVAWGAQDVHPLDRGAHTGDIGAPMLADLGCTYVEVGHAERRRDHAETPQLIAAKVAAVLRWGMTVILCVGERRRMDPVAAARSLEPDLERALAGVPDDEFGRVVVAYEPTWAIGQGSVAAPPDEVGAVHAGLRAWLEARAPGPGAARIIYGGSVDEANAGPLLAHESVDGVFIGRRALDPHAFAAIAHIPVRAVPPAGAHRDDLPWL